jgi:acetolactate synthase-1/2/3 large subunit
MNGADLLATELKREGVDWLSTLCGNGLFAFYSACVKAGIRLIDLRNEQAAAYMADAYARLTSRVGVCAVSSGIAHCNALTGIANAYFDGAPVMLITGASPGYGAGRGVFQEFDQAALAAPLCKYATSVTRVSELAFKVKQAFASATGGRPGPVHLTIPEDVFDEQVERIDPPPAISERHKLGGADPGEIRRVLALLKDSKRPILVAGTNLFYAGDPSAMIRLCEKASIPIIVPIWDRGVIDKPHPNYVGVVGAASGQPKLLPDSELIFLAGAQVDYRTGYLTPPAIQTDVSIERIDIDSHQLRQGIDPTVRILANPATVFNQLLRKAESHEGFSHKEWLNEAQERWHLFRSTMTGPTPKKGAMTGRHIVEVIYPLLTEEVVFLIDGGNIGQWAHMLADRYPGNWLTCGASAVVGWGLPGAMGAKLAYPSRQVLLLSGDGAFGFTLGELESASRQGISFVAVVAVDEAWGIVVSTQKQLIGEEGVVASRFAGGQAVRYDQVAKALGANGLMVENPEELRSAILQGFKADRPTVIHVPVQIGGPADTRI